MKLMKSNIREVYDHIKLIITRQDRRSVYLSAFFDAISNENCFHYQDFLGGIFFLVITDDPCVSNCSF